MNFISNILAQIALFFIKAAKLFAKIALWVQNNLLVAGIIFAVVFLLTSAGLWMLFKKTDKKSWYALIPCLRDNELFSLGWSGTIGIVSFVVLPLLVCWWSYRLPHYFTINLSRLAAGEPVPIILIFGILIPIALIAILVFHVVNCVKLAKSFDKNIAFTIGLIVLYPVFVVLLGCDKSVYKKQNNFAMGLKSSQRMSNTLIYILLVLMSVIWLIPFVCIVVQSFRIYPTGLANRLFVHPDLDYKWGFDNYVALWKSDFPQWYKNTFLIALFVAVVQTFIVLCMSYTLSRFRFKLRAGMMRFMLILGMFPGMLTMIILYQVLKDLGLAGSHAVPGLMLVYVASSGMGYYVSKGFFDTIPKSLDEAARVDGATRAQVLFKIILPLAKPIVIYTILTAFMAPWGDFVFAKYIAGKNPGAYNVAVGLQTWMETTTMVSENYTKFCAGGVVVAIPVTILFICLQRYYVEGVMGGAVKG